jgi:WD40 repeat protein
LLQGGSIKVGDFGLARVLERSLTKHTGPMTPAYAPPEFFRGQVAAHSDQYSLAASYCELRGGRLPLTGSLAELAARHLHEPPDLTMLPEPERAAVARALSKDPRERWPNCLAFAVALRQTLAADPAAPAVAGGAAVRESWYLDTGLRTVTALAFSADGRLALLGTWGDLTRLPSASRRHGRQATNYLGVWDLAGRQEFRCFAGHTHGIRGVALSPDGKEVFSCSEDRTLRSWDVAGGREWHRFEGFQGVPTCIAVSPDGRRMVSGSTDCNVRLWSTLRGRQALRFGGWLSRSHKNSVLAVAYSADSRRVLSGGLDKVIHLWDAIRGRRLLSLQGHVASVHCLALSADGKYALSGSKDGTARLWDLQGGRQVWCAPAAGRPVSCVALAPGVGLALAGNEDGTLRLWELRGGVERFSFPAHAKKVLAAAFPGDGRCFLTGDADGCLKEWQLPM